MRTSGQVIRLALEDGRYKFDATPPDLGEGKIEFMCHMVQELYNEQKITSREEDLAIEAIRKKLSGRFTLHEWLMDQLDREPSERDVAEFWESFIREHS